MKKNIYILIISIVAIFFAVMYLIRETEIVVKKEKVLQLDTTIIYVSIPADTIIKNSLKVIYKDIKTQDSSYSSHINLNLSFVGNIFEKNRIDNRVINIRDIYQYIITKPFITFDTLITKKQDTIYNQFSLLFDKNNPTEFHHIIKYSPLENKTIIKKIEIEKPIKWYDENWFRIATHVVAVLGTAYILKK